MYLRVALSTLWIATPSTQKKIELEGGGEGWPYTGHALSTF